MLSGWRTIRAKNDVPTPPSSQKELYNIVEDAKENIAFDVALKITLLTLIVHGDQDKIVPYEGSELLSKLLPNAALHTVSGSNHNYSLSTEHFEEMSQVLREFLVEESKKVPTSTF